MPPVSVGGNDTHILVVENNTIVTNTEVLLHGTIMPGLTGVFVPWVCGSGRDVLGGRVGDGKSVAPPPDPSLPVSSYMDPGNVVQQWQLGQ